VSQYFELNQVCIVQEIVAFTQLWLLPHVVICMLPLQLLTIIYLCHGTMQIRLKPIASLKT
jgi:hypothetical protein